MVNRIMYLAIACLTFIMITAPISPSTNPRQNCRRLLQHEVGHYLGIEHGDSFNNLEAEDCWNDALEEEDNSDGSGGSDHLIVVIQITENWVCEYEAITVCEEAEDDSGETVCWTEWKLLRCYQVS